MTEFEDRLLSVLNTISVSLAKIEEHLAIATAKERANAEALAKRAAAAKLAPDQRRARVRARAARLPI